MTTLRSRLPAPLDTGYRRLVTLWRSLFTPGDITTLLICIALLLVPVYALRDAGWTIALRTVVPVAALGVLCGFLLSRTRYNELFALIVGGLYGFAIVILIASFNQPEGFSQGFAEVVNRFIQWLVDALSGGVNQDDLVFTLLVASLFWFFGYNAAWHVFRIDRVWLAILPPSLILIANNLFYVGDRNLTPYLLAFVFMALLLLVRSHMEARQWEWYSSGIRVPKRLRRQFLRVGALVALLVLLIGLGIPLGDLQERLDRFQEFLQGEPARQLADAWSRLFAAGDLGGPTTTDFFGGDSLQLSGAISLGDQVVMLVSVPRNDDRRYYWRSRVFENYSGNVWTSAATTRLTDPEAPFQVVQEPFFEGVRIPVEQTYTIAMNASRLVYTAPQPDRVDLATRTDLRYGSDGRLANTMMVSVIRPYRVLYRGDTYRATSLLSNATADQLRAASTDYPREIADLYLTVPPTTTGRTLALASQIAADAGALTPYDRAKAVERWLRTNIEYNESIPAPPAGQDAVDWVLFDYREGYCNYYASAMIVMLRYLGVPARMAAGFSEGEWSDAEQAFVVRERDAHTWVEVYFPGYGWVEFEPTAAKREINRGDPSFSQEQPTPSLPTATPTPSPSPTPTSTPTPGAPPSSPEAQTMLTATSGPTQAPTPTATPIVAPTQPPPLRPPPREPLNFLVSALTTVLLTLLMAVAVLLVLLFVYWWWEWRGMRGMNPVVRAYARLLRYIPLAGIRVPPDRTPEERRQDIVQRLPAAEPPVTALTRLYNNERYAPPGRRADEELRTDIAERAMSQARGTILTRWLRRLLPWGRK